MAMLAYVSPPWALELGAWMLRPWLASGSHASVYAVDLTSWSDELRAEFRVWLDSQQGWEVTQAG